MPKYLIEREVPNLGKMSTAELQHLAQRSCSVLREMPGVQWMESYVTDDKLYCVYIAPNEQAVLVHARQGGFPADRISRIGRTIDPTTSEA